MKKNISKEKVLGACIHKQDELVKNYEDRLNTLKDDAYDQGQSASQSEDRTAGKVDLLNTYKTELVFAQREQSYLQSLDVSGVNTKAEPGALVMTDKLNFFIGVSSEKIEVDGEEIFGISTEAPIYKSMAGLEKGERFKFNDTEYIIQSVS